MNLLRSAIIEGAGGVSLFDLTDDCYCLVRTGADGAVTSDLDDYLIVGRGNAENAWWGAVDDLCWLTSAAGRNAARDIAVDDALTARAAHPAGKGGKP